MTETHAAVAVPDLDVFDLKAPHAIWNSLRDQAPVYYDAGSGYWVVTRYEDIKGVFDDYQTFSAEIAQAPFRPLCDEAKKIIARSGFTSGLSARVPPDHTRIRKVAQSAFGPRRFKSIEPKIEAIIDNALNEAAKLGSFDFFRQVAYPVPAQVLFTMMGIPDEDVPQVKDWAVSRALLTWGDLNDEEQVVHAKAMTEYWAYCRNLIDARRETPGDDFPSDLLRAQADGADITDEEIAGVMYSTLFAGHETTTTLMANAVIALMTHRETWNAICKDPGLIKNATEEILRYTPSIVSWRRLAKADTTIGGIDIPEGSKILLVMGSGNRDESAFPCGEEFDITRQNARTHLSFGYGIHFCLGFQLAKMEFGIMLRELTKRFPDMTLIGDQEIDYLKNISFRVPLRVDVDLGLGG